VAALAAAVAAASHALALTYPGAAPCNTTLQACVTGAVAGDTIEIATNTPIAEVVDIDKSLTIQAAAGFAPQVQFLFVGVTSVSKTVTIRGMAGGGAVRGFLGPGGGSLVLNVVGNALAAGSNAAIGIDTNFVAGTYGTVTLVATDNVLTDTGGPFGCASAIVVGVGAPTTFDATIARNRMTLTDLSQCGGIEVLTSGTAGGTVTAEANDIRGSNFDFGIVVRPTGTGALDGTIVDNLVVGQNGNTGSPGGIVLYAGGDNTPLTAAVVNNTVANGRTGIFVGARTDLGATIDGVIANNILAFNTSYDMGIDPGIAITNDHNLVTSTGGYGFDVGPGTLVGDPRFIDAAGGDFHLARNSPGVDSGRDSALDASFTTDLDGAPRRNGRIDRGAYETAGPGNPIPADAPLALVIAALTIAGLAMRRLASVRRR
jgi:hypothetical protein